MSRQNLAQGGAHPWVAHGCLDGAAGFATDAMQLLRPGVSRRRPDRRPALDLPSERLQHEVACPDDPVARRRARAGRGRRRGRSSACSSPITPRHRAMPISRGSTRCSRPRATSRRVDGRAGAPVRSLLQDAPPVAGRPLGEAADRASAIPTARRGARRRRAALVLRAGRRAQPPRRAARQGADAWRAATARILRTGQACCSTRRRCARPAGCTASSPRSSRSATPRSTSCSRSRAIPTTSPARAGLRILVDAGGGWRLLAVPSAFEMGLSDCRWIYRLDDRTVTVRAVAVGRRPGDAVARSPSRASPAASWSSATSCSASASSTMPAASRSTPTRKRFAFRPDPDSLWGQRYPDAVYHLVTSTPDAIEAIGGDELLYADGQPRGGAYVALRTRPTSALRLRRRRLDDRPGGGGAARGEIRARRRRCRDASRRPRGTGSTSPAACASAASGEPASPRSTRSSRGSRTTP